MLVISQFCDATDYPPLLSNVGYFFPFHSIAVSLCHQCWLPLSILWCHRLFTQVMSPAVHQSDVTRRSSKSPELDSSLPVLMLLVLERLEEEKLFTWVASQQSHQHFMSLSPVWTPAVILLSALLNLLLSLPVSALSPSPAFTFLSLSFSVSSSRSF